MIRLFKKLDSMRVIVSSLTASILPVLNAFVIMLLITSIYSVFAVSLYGQDEPLLFGRFSASFFTVRSPAPLPRSPFRAFWFPGLGLWLRFKGGWTVVLARGFGVRVAWLGHTPAIRARVLLAAEQKRGSRGSLWLPAAVRG